MGVREEMRAHRAATTCALGIVVIGGIVVAARPSAADSSASVACHVTHPNGSTPPGGRPSDTHHGKHGLWTVLPRDGMLVITTTTTRPSPPGTTFGMIYPDGSLSTKFAWWGSRSAAAKLRIRGRRLDAPARRLRLTLGTTARSPYFWATWPRFATSGCWRVTAKSGRAHLTFTISVHSADG
jgi:hypothetical protein